MNAPGPAAAKPPPPPPTITSLASHSRSSMKQPNGGTTTSIAEALATSMADYVCDNRRKMNSTTATTAKTAAIRVVSDEQHTPQAKQSPPSRSIGPRTVTMSTASNNNNNNNNCSSMSSAVADLASGMFAFQPSTHNHSNHGGGNHSNHGNNSAPIISGTAAAVLALQSPFDNADTPHSAIVSNTSSVETGGTIANPSPIALSLSGCAAVSSPTETQIDYSPNCNRSTSSRSPQSHPSQSQSSPQLFPTRYADGAPIIAGTAAAQMEAIATATAARITSITDNEHWGGGSCDTVVINAVASLGPSLSGGEEGDSGCFGDGETCAGGERLGGARSHGFNGGLFTGWAKNTVSTTTGATISKRGSNAVLSWVDHNRKNDARVTLLPEDAKDGSFGSLGAYQASIASSSRQQQHVVVTAQSSAMAPISTAGGKPPGGGMDILAEIICHAPPMSLPVSLQASPMMASSSASNSMTSYPPQHQASFIPSYQEIYHGQGSSQSLHHQAQSSHQAQHQLAQHAQHAQHQQQVEQHHQQVQQQAEQNPSLPNRKRVCSIPSYQEIYREMGLSPRHADERSSAAQSQYLVEEVQLDGHSNSHHSQCNGGSGKRTMSHHYQSRAPTTHFGHAHRRVPDTNAVIAPATIHDGIEEGKELYTRKDLMHLGGHLLEHKDVHGNMREGCDSLIVGSLEKDIREVDGLLWFLYSTDRPNGGGSLCQSYHKKRPMRIFRSSLLAGKYAPPFLDVEDDIEEDSDVAYRYDGLYMVRAVWDVNGNETESFPVAGEKGWQTYFCTRIPKKPLDKQKVEGGMDYNAMGCQELWGSIQKMRGVRKPKKFEIPTPPVKLGSMKRACITGDYKDRKCPGFVRPEPVVVVPPPKPPPRAKSPRTVPTPAVEKPRRKQQEEEVESESSSDEEEIVVRQPVRKPQEEKEDGSDSDSSQQQHKPQKKHHMPLSAVQTPAKVLPVLTPRPRLNSVSHSPKKTPSAHHHEDDSSDSETETSASASQMKFTSAPQVKHQPLLVNNRKRRKLSPSKKLLANMEVSAYFPKRASAAKAEAANKEMFGGSRTYTKRKSSETASSAASSSVAKTATAAKTTTAAKLQPARAPSARKRTKIVHKGNDSSSSSEEDEPPKLDVVDQSILTIGSRVLVTYKGSVFKATIRKRREKNSRHDFLIHYDGNKKTNVHWVSLERITEILEVNVDTPPKKKNPAVTNNKKGGGNKGKRKSLTKQESVESSSSVDKKAPLGRQASLQQGHYTNAEEENDLSQVKEARSSSHDQTMDEACSKKDPNNTQESLLAIADQKNDQKPASKVELPAIESHPSNDNEESNVNSEKDIDADENDATKQKENASSEGINVPAEKVGEHKKLSDSAVLDKEKPMDVELSESAAGPINSESNDAVHKKPTPHGNETTPAGDTTAKNPRKAVATNICIAQASSSSSKDPLLTLALEAEEAENSDIGSVVKESDENSAGSSGHVNQQKQAASSSAGEATSEFKYQVGSQVYVEYRQIFYSSMILKARRKRSATEYLIHYEGYKKSSNRWVKENILHEVNAATTHRYEEQRFIPADILYESVQQPPDFSMVTRRKKASECSEPPASLCPPDDSAHSVTQKKPPPRRMRSDASDAALETLAAGVAFLAGSMVFVEWSGALYLAKMLKKRYSGNRTEYLISYDGFDFNHDAWVPIHNIYEVNPQTKRAYKLTLSGTGDDKPKRRAPPGPKRRETRKKAYDDEAAAVTAQVPKTRNNGESRVQPKSASTTTSSIDMKGIEPGVEFLPGSTLFAEYKDGLCLAKMLKRRGKGDYMEYYVQYNGLKKSEETWISVSLVYEINPQTKRMFRQLSKKEK